MTLRIRIEHGQGAGRTWRLAQEGSYVLGRLPSATIQILDMKVSKDHCRVVVLGSGDEAKTFLEDRDSRHGTLVNGQPVATKVRLKPGDEIRLGMSILRVLSDGEADVDAVPASSVEKEKAAADLAAGTPKKKRRTFPPDALVDTEIGGYKVMEKIGQGGMGSVYMAEQLSLHREVALKVLSEKFTSDRAFVDQFVNEARSAAALNHPNVVQVYDVGRQNGRYYFSMEYVPGGSLEEGLAEDGPSDWRDALNWMIDASNAFIFAQKREILHRDVKPDNLMLAEDGSAKLCDLGLAKKAANPDMLAAGIIGTPAFISPEAIRRRKEIDVRSDLYSLGCTFYRLLTGVNPYPGKTVKEILLGHLRAPVPRVSDKKPNLPRDLDEVIFRLMQKDPVERYATPQELRQALDRIRVQHGLEAHGLRSASRKPLVIALIAVVLLGAAGLIYLLSKPKETIRIEDAGARAAADDARAAEEKALFDTFVSTAKNEELVLELEQADGHIEGRDNWALALWPELADDFDALAKQLEADETYGTREEVLEIATAARKNATQIREYVRVRRGIDEDVKSARAREIGSLEDALSKRRKTYDEAIEVKAWVKAGEAASPEAIAELVKPFLERTVQDVLPPKIPAETRARFEGVLLLHEEEHIRPLLAKFFPGEVPGETLRAGVLEQATRTHQEILDTIAELRDSRSRDAYDEARKTLDAYLEALPEEVPAGAGALVEAIQGFQEEAETLLDEVEEADQKLLHANIDHDRLRYFMLLKSLRAPDGFLVLLRLDEALEAANLAAKAMRYPGYRDLARQVLEDVEAVKHVFERLAATFPDGWSSDRVEWTDARGREQTARVREVTLGGIKLGSDVHTFEALGPSWVLRHVLAAKGGEPRFTFEGEDHRGLAILSEMAIDYEAAAKHYEAYCNALPDDRSATRHAIGRRLGPALRLERTAAEAWRLAALNEAKVRAFLDAHDPLVIGEDAFWEKTNREEIQGERAELSSLLDQAWRAIQVLRDPQYAATVWGSVVRQAPVPGVRYAGEPVFEREAQAPGEDEPSGEDEASGDEGPDDDDGETPREEGAASDG